MDKNKTTKKLERDERLRPAMLALEVGDSLIVPYKQYSASAVRTTASQFKAAKVAEFDTVTRGDKVAIVTRVK